MRKFALSRLVRAVSCGLLLTVLVAAAGCSLPKIIVLTDPLSVEEHNDLGKIYESQGKDELAFQQYQDALRKDPDALSTLLLMGELSYRMKRYPEAEKAYKRAIKLQPGNGDLYNNLCWVYLDQHAELDMADDLIRTALTKKPEHRGYYLDTQGVILLRTGRIAEAIESLKEAAKGIPADNRGALAEVHQHLAEAYRTTGDEGNARASEEAARAFRTRH